MELLGCWGYAISEHSMNISNILQLLQGGLGVTAFDAVAHMIEGTESIQFNIVHPLTR